MSDNPFTFDFVRQAVAARAFVVLYRNYELEVTLHFSPVFLDGVELSVIRIGGYTRLDAPERFKQTFETLRDGVITPCLLLFRAKYRQL